MDNRSIMVTNVGPEKEGRGGVMNWRNKKQELEVDGLQENKIKQMILWQVVEMRVNYTRENLQKQISLQLEAYN